MVPRGGVLAQVWVGGRTVDFILFYTLLAVVFPVPVSSTTLPDEVNVLPTIKLLFPATTTPSPEVEYMALPFTLLLSQFESKVIASFAIPASTLLPDMML